MPITRRDDACCCCCSAKNLGACITVGFGGVLQCEQRTPCQCRTANGFYMGEGQQCDDPQYGPISRYLSCHPCQDAIGTTCGMPLLLPPATINVVLAGSENIAATLSGEYTLSVARNENDTPLYSVAFHIAYWYSSAEVVDIGGGISYPRVAIGALFSCETGKIGRLFGVPQISVSTAYAYPFSYALTSLAGYSYPTASDGSVMCGETASFQNAPLFASYYRYLPEGGLLSSGVPVGLLNIDISPQLP